MTSIVSIVLGLVVLGILVFIHELGHFLAAKSCRIRVLAFSLGFGAPIFKRTVKGTEYRIGSIPFGGYVKMAGENPEEGGEQSPDDFPSKPVWQRAFVAIAGPAANFIAAFMMLWVMYIWGVDRPLYMENTIVGAVSDSSAALRAGFAPGDSVVTINGKPVKSWEDIQTQFAQQEVSYTIEYVRSGQTFTTTVVPEKSKSIPKHMAAGLLPPLPAVVADVIDSSAADKAGLLPGDTIVTIDSQRIYSWFQMTSIIEKWQGGNPLSFTVSRKNESLTLAITPKYNETEKRNLVGIRVGEGKARIVKYSPAGAIDHALDKTWEYTIMIFDVVGKLVSQKVPASQLSGPVGIIPASGFMVMQGLSNLLNFMALIGINLAVLNLLPLVITDGGMLLFLILEAIRGKPLSVKTQSMFNKVAIAFFLLLFLYVTFNDVMRLPDIFKLLK